MAIRRKRQAYSAKTKAKVAVDALKEASTVAEVACRHSVHTTQVTKWKKHAIARMPELFADGRAQVGAVGKEDRERARLIRELYEQVGRLKMENDWLKKKLG